MKNYLLTMIFMIAFFSLNANERVWIVDVHNPERDRNDWTAKWWRASYHQNGNDLHGRDILSPFWASDNGNMDFLSEKENSDFRKENGWALLRANLGSKSTAVEDLFSIYVVLYNTNTSVVRVFNYEVQTTGSHTSSVLKLITEPGNNTGIVSTVATGEYYFNALDRRSTNSHHSLVKYIEYYTPEWNFADFYVAFDPIIQQSDNTLRVVYQALNVSDVDLVLNGVAKAHMATNKTALDYAVSFGKNFIEFWSAGTNLRENMMKIPGELESKGALASFTNKLNSFLHWLNDNGVTGLAPYVWTSAGIVDFFASDPSRGAIKSFSVSGSITGTITTPYTKNHFSFWQPGARPDPPKTNSPDYNYTLGTVHLNTTPEMNIRILNGSLPGLHHYSARLTSLPHRNDWSVNSYSGLKEEPSNVQVSLAFRVIKHKNHINDPIFDHDYEDFVNRYRSLRDGNYDVHHFYTEFMDIEDALNIAINIRNATFSTNMYVKYRATFDYLEAGKEPYVYVANYYTSLGNPIPVNSFFDVQPIQNVQNVTSINNPNGYTIPTNRTRLDRRYIVDFGGSLTIEHNMQPNTNSDNNKHYGFFVNHGTLTINGANVNMGNARIIASGPNSVIDIKNGANISLSNILLEDGAELFVNGAKLNSTNGELKIIGQNSTIKLNNQGEINLSNSNMKISERAEMKISEKSKISINNGSLLSLDNSVNVDVNNSSIAMNNGNLHLNRRSIISFNNNSRFNTYNKSKIVGHTAGRWREIVDEFVEKEDATLQLRGNNSFNWSCIAKGDRIEFYDSIVRLNNELEISSGSNSLWDGIFLYNSFFNDFIEGQECDHNVLRGDISGIRYIYLDNSFVDLNRADIHGIRQVFAHKSSELHMHNSDYHHNTEGIHIADKSRVWIWESKIFKNEYGVIIEYSPYIENRIWNSEIYENDDVGLQIIQSSVLIGSTILRDNLKGYIDFSSNQNIIRDGCIMDNHFVEVAFRREYYPAFIRHPDTLERPSIGNTPDNNTSWLMMALGNSNKRVNIGAAIVDTTNVSRFYPTKNTYDFNDPMPSEISEKYEYAIEQIILQNYSSAMNAMIEVIELDQSSEYSRLAISFLPNLQVSLGTDLNDLIDFLDSIQDDSLEIYILETRAAAHLYNGKYVQAIEDLDVIIEQPEDTIRSLFAELNREYAIWKQQQQNNGPRSFGDENNTASIAEYLQKRHDILNQIFNMNKVEDSAGEEMLPEIKNLEAHNYPNPFNPETTIRFALPSTENVKIDIFNIRGQKVKTLLNENMNRGHHTVMWNGTDINENSVGSGVYFYKIEAGSQKITNKMLLMK